MLTGGLLFFGVAADILVSTGVNCAVVMQEAAMPLRPGQLVRMHSMTGPVAVVNGETGVLKHTSRSLWVVELVKPCVIGSHKKHELRIDPKYLTGLAQVPMLFKEKLQAALVAERQEMQASGALEMVRYVVPNPLAEAVHAGHTNVYDATVLLAFDVYLAECGIMVSTAARGAPVADGDPHTQEMADRIEEQIMAAFEKRVNALGLRGTYRGAPESVLITALRAEYRSTCVEHHAAHHAARQQQIDDALHKFLSKVHPCHNEGCAARGQKNAFDATTGQFRSAICSRCKVGGFFDAVHMRAGVPVHAVAAASVSCAAALDCDVDYCLC